MADKFIAEEQSKSVGGALKNFAAKFSRAKKINAVVVGVKIFFRGCHANFKCSQKCYQCEQV